MAGLSALNIYEKQQELHESEHKNTLMLPLSWLKDYFFLLN